MDLPFAISTIEEAVGDPRPGLPLDIFHLVSRIAPLINVDLLIQDDGCTLLTWRDDEFFGAGWHVPGGIIRYKEKAANRIRACAQLELGADVTFDPEPILISEFIRGTTNRGHFISLLYRCQLVMPADENRRAAPGIRPTVGEWRWHRRCPADLIEVQSPYARFF